MRIIHHHQKGQSYRKRPIIPNSEVSCGSSSEARAASLLSVAMVTGYHSEASAASESRSPISPMASRYGAASHCYSFSVVLQITLRSMAPRRIAAPPLSAVSLQITLRFIRPSIGLLHSRSTQPTSLPSYASQCVTAFSAYHSVGSGKFQVGM
jgi:hypothetical protein